MRPLATNGPRTPVGPFARSRDDAQKMSQPPLSSGSFSERRRGSRRFAPRKRLIVAESATNLRQICGCISMIALWMAAITIALMSLLKSGDEVVRSAAI